jgi:outer membrane protein OmpA-like peptidoglycan-associated protein
MFLKELAFTFVITIIAFVFLSYPACAAEEIKPKIKPDPSGGFSISATTGSYFFSVLEQRNATPLFGIKLGYETLGKLSDDNLGIEGTLNYFTTRSKTDASNASGYLFRLDATYPFPVNKKWLPFVAVGVGGKSIDGITTPDRNFLLNFGLGVKYFLENYLAVRVDARQLRVFDGSATLTNYEVSGGLSYYFGKVRTKKTVPTPAPEKKKIVVLEDDPAKNKDKEVGKPTGTGDAAVDKNAAANQVTPVTELASVAPVFKNEVLKKYSVEFDHTKSSVKPNYFMRFKEIAEMLKSSDDVVAHVDGHTDIVGTLRANILLSQKRAQSVQNNLLALGVNPKQIIITANGPALPIADNTTIDGKHNNRRVNITVVKIDPAAHLKAEQELQFEAERNEIERLVVDSRAKSRIKAAITLQEENSAVPVDSSTSLSFEIVNQGVSTEEYMLTLLAPKEFEGSLTRANRPDEKVTLLQLAPDEKFKGSVLFRIPAGMVDGQKTTLSVKAASTQYGDVIFQKDSDVLCSAPLLRVVVKLAKPEVSPGERVRYRLTMVNAGSLSARDLSIKLQLPPQVEFIGAPEALFTQETAGMIVFKVDTLESGKLKEISIDVKVRDDSAIGEELLWNAEVVDGNLQRRTRFTDRASIVRIK